MSKENVRLEFTPGFTWTSECIPHYSESLIHRLTIDHAGIVKFDTTMDSPVTKRKENEL